MVRKRGGLKLYIDEKGDHRWRTIAGNGRIQSDSGESYKRKAAAEAGAISSAIDILEALRPDLLRCVRVSDPGMKVMNMPEMIQ